MNITELFSIEELDRAARALFEKERETKRLDGWFISREIARECDERLKDMPNILIAAHTLKSIAESLPLYIDDNAIFAGTQDDAFARSYALINPSFKVESFTGYCDPTAVFDDIEPNGEFTRERINQLREYTKTTPYVKSLEKTYSGVSDYTSEAVFFIEQVTGHLIPDFRATLAEGIDAQVEKINARLEKTTDAKKKLNYEAMKIALQAVLILAERYQKLALEKYNQSTDPKQKEKYKLMTDTLSKVPRKGSANLYEAIQSFILLWQAMCLEQAPNPFAFSVGNADRIF
ncbi:MAG TPA: pyruvate formate lyase family protein, partial [Clostridia bacterium]|nr:pyruvate formate lyase family protein [Clostridia bacterium]